MGENARSLCPYVLLGRRMGGFLYSLVRQITEMAFPTSDDAYLDSMDCHTLRFQVFVGEGLETDNSLDS